MRTRRRRECVDAHEVSREKNSMQDCEGGECDERDLRREEGAARGDVESWVSKHEEWFERKKDGIEESVDDWASETEKRAVAMHVESGRRIDEGGTTAEEIETMKACCRRRPRRRRSPRSRSGGAGRRCRQGGRGHRDEGGAGPTREETMM